MHRGNTYLLYIFLKNRQCVWAVASRITSLPRNDLYCVGWALNSTHSLTSLPHQKKKNVKISKITSRLYGIRRAEALMGPE